MTCVSRAWHLWIQHKEGSCNLQLQGPESSHQERHQMQGNICTKPLEWNFSFLNISFKILSPLTPPPPRTMNWPTCTHWSWIQTRPMRWELTMKRWSLAPWRTTGTCCHQRRSKTRRPRNPATGTTEPRSTTPATPNLRWEIIFNLILNIYDIHWACLVNIYD